MNPADVTPADVAVVIPVFNRSRTVLDALDSVIAQTVPPRRVVVVNDGSTDTTAASVRKWIAKKDCADLVSLERQPHSGAATARNAGLAKVSDTPYVAFLDSDDLWPEDFIARTVGMLGGDDTAVAASCDRRRVSTTQGATIIESLASIAHSPTEWLFAKGAGVLSCSLLRTETVKSLGGYEDGLRTGQDSELLLRLSTKGHWLHCPGAPVTFRRGVALERGEHDHVRSAYPDYKLKWALIHEEFVVNQGGADVLPAAFRRRELARRWSQAARQLLAAGRLQKARACFKRSARWQIRPKTLLRLGLSYLPTRLHDARR